MKRTIKNDYPIVDSLPAGAMTVKKYADQNNITTAYVYIKESRGKADYEIVTFQEVVFIIPKKQTAQ